MKIIWQIIIILLIGIGFLLMVQSNISKAQGEQHSLSSNQFMSAGGNIMWVISDNRYIRICEYDKREGAYRYKVSCNKDYYDIGILK